MSSSVMTRRGERLQRLISRDVLVARGLLDRDDLLEMLDRAVAKRVTVVSAPPGSGKTSLLRAWADRPAWVACFNPDGVFVDESVGVTYSGPDEVASLISDP